jgi:hypothetical protein
MCREKGKELPFSIIEEAEIVYTQRSSRKPKYKNEKTIK